MDSDYGMHDTSDVELLEDLHGEETADYYYYDDDDADDGHYDSSGNDCEVSNYSILRRKQQSYTVLSEADIRQRLEDDITAISTVLSISRVAAGILLRRYNWDVIKVHEEWFADEERVRKAAGLLENPVVDTSNARQLTCGICFDSLPKKDICSAACGHPFCSSCWAGYISTAINDGPGCLMLRCPDPGCAATVGQDMIDVLGSKNDRKKYLRYFIRSYIEDNRKTKWCPAPGCDYAVHFSVGSGSYDVICCCSHSFCWNCSEEAHRPVDCETVSKWILKNSAESENTKWILAYTKPCPKCSRPIEKNSGCMHMTCTPPCKFEFCWICLGDWSEHRYRSACNGYGRWMQGTAQVDETNQQRQMGKKSLQRYAHYYERWAANHLSMQKAVVDLEKMQNLQLGQLSEIQGEPESQLKFIIEGCSQIVECRRVLKWTYAYGYYLPEAEHAKIQLFEYLQGEAEAGLERLHRCVENELQVHLTEKQGPLQEFTAFRSNLVNLTKVTRTYFENLVGALEKGLSDVDPQTSKKRKTSQVRCATSTSSNCDVFDYWQCQRCTYANASSVTACQMCSQPDY